MQGVSTNRDVRVSNRKNIVNSLFRHGPMTKQQLSELLGLSLPTISVILKELADKGLVAKGQKLESSGGRPAQHITLVFDARLSIGISVTTNHVRFALVDLGPKVVACERHRISHTQGPNFWQDVKSLLNKFIEKFVDDPSCILGYGVSILAPVIMDQSADPASLHTVKNDWDIDAIRETFGPDTVINNVSKLAGYAQSWGAGESDDFIYLMIGHGIGGAIIADRHVVGDISKNAEFGHMVLDDSGPLCSCGQHGCFGRYCSAQTLEMKSGLSLAEFFDKLREGDVRCGEMWKTYMHYLSMAVNNIRLVFDTDVIIGGEMSEYIREYEYELRQLLAQRNPFGDSGDYLRIGSFGEFDSAFGAALTHIDRFLS